MAIEELKCHEFRNLKNTHLKFNSKLNLITGENGSGKTSLLESIYILSTSKSFRTTYLKNCIHHEQSKFTLFGKFKNHTVGVQKESVKLLTKIDNKLINKRSQLAKLQSVLVIDSSSFDLITGSKQKRREFLDWALFHVEHEFSDQWVKYKNILKQRNQLLRTKKLKEIKYWDESLIQYNHYINDSREKLLTQITALYKNNLALDSISDDLMITYEKGWKKDLSYKEALNDKFEIDCKRGFTSVGAHKSDIKFSVNNKDIKDVFSRGQIKKLIIQLFLTLMDYVREHSHSVPIFIVDDLMAELDKKTMKDVIVSLVEKDYQIFISNIENNNFIKELSIEKSVFHVKHGQIITQEIG